MRFVGAILTALLALAAPAAAQQPEPRTLEVPDTASWQHAETGTILPPRVAGLTRAHIGDNSDTELDVIATYSNRDEGIIALVYIYRTMTPDVALWFDRALAAIVLPTGQELPAIHGFTRPGASAASGLRTALEDNVPGMRSTAIAIAPHGSWLVKVRLGSRTLEPAALAQRLDAFVAGLTWPAETGTARVAVPVELCPRPLRLRDARIVTSSVGDVLMDAVAGSVEAEARDGAPPAYCREPGATVERGVYRPDRANDRYLIALQDAGIAIAVGEALNLSALLGEGGARRRYSVTLLDRDSSSVFPSFNRLPRVEQVLALVRGASPQSTTVGGRESR